jgi:hypothetical protein
LFESQRPAQVAADLGMPVGSVYMARNRVFAALRSEVWDWSTGRLLESAAMPKVDGLEVAVSPDGRRLVTGGGRHWTPMGDRASRDYAPRIWRLP